MVARSLDDPRPPLLPLSLRGGPMTAEQLLGLVAWLNPLRITRALGADDDETVW